MFLLSLYNPSEFNSVDIEFLYDKFKEDFIINKAFLENIQKGIKYKLTVKENILCECPFTGEKKPERFWHIITKEEINKKKKNNPCPNEEIHRSYDSARAKRIHWIKIVINNWEINSDIVHFYEKKGTKSSLIIWHTKKDFVVVIRKLSNSSDKFLVTSYLVYKDSRKRFWNKFEKYKKSAPLGIEWF